MALVRKSNTRRNIIMISALGVAIVAALIWYFVINKPLDITSDPDTVISGRRDINKLQQFNDIDFDNQGLFSRPDYQRLQSHGGSLPEQSELIESGVTNPFVATQ